jgi:co-chaperonin GroES (HSP10)
MTNIEPLGSLILIKEIEESDRTTKSGLVLAASIVDTVLKRGTVIKTGPGDHDNSGKHHAIPLEAGQTVIYAQGHATEIEDSNGDKYFFINWRTLFGTEVKNA